MDDRLFGNAISIGIPIDSKAAGRDGRRTYRVFAGFGCSKGKGIESRDRFDSSGQLKTKAILEMIKKVTSIRRDE